ncbi:hypothetical protein PspLS_01147 [Pyricularia sp. CBS 133598]|nr:hypothetical protein PspLS_01147 [Pyricularia sp. CBS 133598]
MATTMLPFLYQTRTIQRLVRSTPAHLAFCSLLHTTSAHNFYKKSSSPDYQPPESHASKLDTSDPIPFELPEDLAADPRFNPPPEDVLAEHDDESGPGTITSKERQAFNYIFKEIARTSKTPSGNAMTTTTDTFGSLFDSGNTSRSTANTFGESVPHEQSIISSIIGDASISVMNSTDEDASKNKRQLQHMDLLKNMRQLHNIDPFGHNGDSDMSAQERYGKLLSFPPSLRDAAKRALGILKPVQKVGLGDDTPEMAHPEHMPLDREEYLAGRKDPSVLEANASQTDETDVELVGEPSLLVASEVSPQTSGPLPAESADSKDFDRIKAEESRTHERQRVSALMLQTKSDFELWDVLEREVFSMITWLGLDGKENRPQRRGRKLRQYQRKHTPEGEPVPQLDLLVHGPLYSSNIIFGLKTMDARYPGSPLALAILPRVKALGLASYILGASVDLYTAQMKLHWDRYRDVRAVLDLMDEMRSAELLFGQQHLAMLEEMERSMMLCVSGQRGDVMANIFASPEWATLLVTRITHFKKWIQTSLQSPEDNEPPSSNF